MLSSRVYVQNGEGMAINPALKRQVSYTNVRECPVTPMIYKSGPVISTIFPMNCHPPAWASCGSETVQCLASRPIVWVCVRASRSWCRKQIISRLKCVEAQVFVTWVNYVLTGVLKLSSRVYMFKMAKVWLLIRHWNDLCPTQQ